MRILVALILFACCGPCFSQGWPKDYFNKDVLNPQQFTAGYFRTWLELNQPDSALHYVDEAYLRAHPGIRKKLVEAAALVSKIHEQCLPHRDGMFSFYDSVNVLTIFYTIPPTPKLSMELGFRQGDKDSKIISIVLMDEKQLARDRKKHAHDSDEPPPIPPPMLK